MMPFWVSVFDADPQLPDGIISGHVDWVGQYEECMRVKASNLKVTVSPGFDAKYCRSFYMADGVSISKLMQCTSTSTLGTHTCTRTVFRKY